MKFVCFRDEGYSNGGVVVEDCLELLLTLVKSNPANQTLLREVNHSLNILKFAVFARIFIRYISCC